MLTTSDVQGIKVLKKKGKRKSWGKVWRTVFSPDGKRVVGFIIRRPDFMLMVKRDDKFLALDAMGEDDGRLYGTKDNDSWDERAIKRLGLDWENCILWEGMDVRTKSGDELGHVGDISFNTVTGEIADIIINDGATSKAIVGNLVLPAKYYIGYDDGYLVVEDDAMNVMPEGGLAAKAGEAAANASRGMHKTSKKIGDFYDSSTYNLGKMLGKAKRSVEEHTQVEETLDTGSDDKKLVEEGSAAKKQETPQNTSISKEKAKKEPSEDLSERAAKSFGRQLGKTKGMFSAFKEEYKKSSK